MPTGGRAATPLSHEFGLQDIQLAFELAFELARKKPEGFLKAVITF